MTILFFIIFSLALMIYNANLYSVIKELEELNKKLEKENKMLNNRLK